MRNMTYGKPQKPRSALAGHHFHVLVNEAETRSGVSMQGRVIDEVSEGYFLVELAEWMAGSPYEERVFHVSQMTKWLFYDSAEWMRNSFEHGPAWHHRTLESIGVDPAAAAKRPALTGEALRQAIKDA